MSQRGNTCVLSYVDRRYKLKMLTTVLKVPEGPPKAACCQGPGGKSFNTVRQHAIWWEYSWFGGRRGHLPPKFMKIMVPKRCSPPGCPQRQVKLQTCRLAEIEIISVKDDLQSLVAIWQMDIENELVKVGHATLNYGTAGWAWDPSPVLLFEAKLYRACSTSHVWMSPGDIFQHCASAREFVRIFVIWSKETSSPSQTHENHGPEMI